MIEKQYVRASETDVTNLKHRLAYTTGRMVGRTLVAAAVLAALMWASPSSAELDYISDTVIGIDEHGVVVGLKTATHTETFNGGTPHYRGDDTKVEVIVQALWEYDQARTVGDIVKQLLTPSYGKPSIDPDRSSVSVRVNNECLDGTVPSGACKPLVVGDVVHMGYNPFDPDKYIAIICDVRDYETLNGECVQDHAIEIYDRKAFSADVVDLEGVTPACWPGSCPQYNGQWTVRVSGASDDNLPTHIAVTVRRVYADGTTGPYFRAFDAPAERNSSSATVWRNSGSPLWTYYSPAGMPWCQAGKFEWQATVTLENGAEATTPEWRPMKRRDSCAGL